MTTYWGVYRQLKSGKLTYVARSATSNEKLARELAEERSRGAVTRPDGSIARVTAYPHIHKEI